MEPKTVTCQLTNHSFINDTTVAFLADSCNKILFERNSFGIFKILRPNNSVYGIYLVNAGILNGLCFDYFPNGKLRAAVEYKNGHLLGRYSTFHSSGLKYYDGYYSKKGFTGKSFNYYWDNGNVAELINWKDNSARPDKDVKHWGKDGKEIDEQTFWELWLDCD